MARLPVANEAAAQDQGNACHTEVACSTLSATGGSGSGKPLPVGPIFYAMDCTGTGDLQLAQPAMRKQRGAVRGAILGFFAAGPASSSCGGGHAEKQTILVSPWAGVLSILPAEAMVR